MELKGMKTRAWVYVWAFPTTLIGLIIGLPDLRHATIVDGVLEICGPWTNWLLRHGTLLKGGALAMTLGHVVLGRDHEALETTRQHERVHVRQAARWGPLFLPAYGVASLIALARGQGAYMGNAFEREAYAEDQKTKL